MSPFDGFPSGNVRLIRIPTQFFSQVLPEIEDLDELKVTLYFFWRLDQMEGTFRGLQYADLEKDQGLLLGLGKTPEEGQTSLNSGLQKAVERGTLLQVEVSQNNETHRFFFLNTPRGRAAVAAVQQGKWNPLEEAQPPPPTMAERPNIFQLYEDHIGPLTPLIADALREAEETYPAEWIEEAIRIAVENNVRRWRYVDAILSRWKEEGRHEREHRRDTEADRRRYVEGRYSEFIEH
jgi:DnaD/phage-associated family protein